MIYYSFLENESENEIELLIHSDSDEFIGYLKGNTNRNTDIIEVTNIGTRYKNGTLAYKAISMYAHIKNKSIMSSRDIINKNPKVNSHWKAFNKGFYKSTSFPLPVELEIEYFKDNGQNKSYNMEPESRIVNTFRFHKSNNIPTNLKEVKKESKYIMNILKNKKTFFRSNWFIDDLKPLKQTNHDTGINISTFLDEKEIIANYTSGKCMFLAIALNERFGYEINMTKDRYKGNDFVEHAWVVLDKDNHYDVTGKMNSTNKWNKNDNVFIDVKKECIFELMVKSEEYKDFTVEKGNICVQEASLLIDNYLSKIDPSVCREKRVINNKLKKR